MSDDNNTPPPEDDASLAEFTQMMDPASIPTEELVEVEIDRHRLRQIQTLLIATIDGPIYRLSPIYIEMLVALGNTFLCIAEDSLASTDDLETFTLSRDEVRKLIKVMSAAVDGMNPSAQMVVEAESVSRLIN